MKKLFAVIFAWTLFSTQAFAHVEVEKTIKSEKVEQIQKMLEGADIEEVQAFFAGSKTKLADLSQEELEAATEIMENMSLRDARELASSLGIEDKLLNKMTEEEWESHKGKMMISLELKEDSPALAAFAFLAGMALIVAAGSLMNFWIAGALVGSYYYLINDKLSNEEESRNLSEGILPLY